MRAYDARRSPTSHPPPPPPRLRLARLRRLRRDGRRPRGHAHLADGRPLSRADAWRQMAMFAGHWALRGFGVWAVEERSTGEFIGRIGCFQPEGWPESEIAYTLARHAWGKGYAREGAAAALKYARETLGRTSIVSIIRPANAASIHVATSLGAVPDGEVEFFGAPALLYRYQPVSH